MSQPEPARPVPGPPRVPSVPPAEPGPDASEPLAGLAARPVAEHVAVFQAEHDRLRRELSTIDQL
ncbi:MAG: hypothetical protein JWQ26_1853 [Modestobacter sp.]|jgi:hypothetical protein|nr:hypothetical protein [Modestobacter sp.]